MSACIKEVMIEMWFCKDEEFLYMAFYWARDEYDCLIYHPVCQLLAMLIQVRSNDIKGSSIH